MRAASVCGRVIDPTGREQVSDPATIADGHVVHDAGVPPHVAVVTTAPNGNRHPGDRSPSVHVVGAYAGRLLAALRRRAGEVAPAQEPPCAPIGGGGSGARPAGGHASRARRSWE